jgi:hypothetical protein
VRHAGAFGWDATVDATLDVYRAARRAHAARWRRIAAGALPAAGSPLPPPASAVPAPASFGAVAVAP